MIIAIDFDGTLCRSAYPEIGLENTEVINEALNRQWIGDKLILLTMREGELLDEAVSWCRDRGLNFDAINDNLLERQKEWGKNPRKVYFDELWEDKKLIEVVDGRFKED